MMCKALSHKAPSIGDLLDQREGDRPSGRLKATVHVANPWSPGAAAGREQHRAITPPFNGSSVEGFQVVNQPTYRFGWCFLCHTMPQIENEGPLAVGRNYALRLREHDGRVRQQRHRIEIALQADAGLLPQVAGRPG